MDILIYGILRDNEKSINKYLSQISSFVSNLKDKYRFYISLYENDSKDSTYQIIKEYDYKDFVDYSIVSEKLDLPKYKSIVSENRIKNLSAARNKALLAKNFYLNVDYILAIDTDIEYSEGYVESLIEWEKYGLKNPDMFSGVSLKELTYIQRFLKQMDVDESGYHLYDSWSTRRNSDEEFGHIKSNANFVPVSKFYCTFNGVCFIKAKPIKEGLRYGFYNERLKKFDLEHAVLAEQFHKNGYSEIYIHQNLYCYHT